MSEKSPLLILIGRSFRRRVTWRGAFYGKVPFAKVTEAGRFGELVEAVEPLAVRDVLVQKPDLLKPCPQLRYSSEEYTP